VRTISKLFAVALLALLCLPATLFAQTQQVALASVSAILANGTSCTGTPQVFTTLQNIPNFRNQGQTSHLATATSNASMFQMEIDGIDSLGNVFRLSDLQLGVPTTAKGGIVLTASGYMTNIQVQVTCSSGSTFSVSYSGSFSPTPINAAGTLLNAVDKLPFQTAAANASNSTTFQTPTGSSSGTIVFQYAAAGPAGSSITAQCISNSGTSLSTYTFAPSTATTAQLFNVTAGTCPFVTLTYTSGGASATTYNLEYVFNAQGTVQAIADPCPSTTTPKTSAAIATITAAGTYQIIGGVAGQKIYTCGINLGASWNGTNFTFQWEYGTGALCGTGTTSLSGAYSLSSNTNGIPIAETGPTLFNIPAGNSLCLVVVGSPTAGGIAGFVSFAQQ
jgi:hypothetical protein